MRDSKGFTLIELLIVVVIIGILAAIAIPKFSATREKAYFAAMKSDLKNLSSAQEIYYSLNNYNYASAVTDLTDTQASSGVTLTVTNGSTTGWAATATHAAMAGDTNNLCGYYYGSATPPTLSPTLSSGVVGCNGGN